MLDSAGQDGNPFARDAEIYVIAVNLRDAQERKTGLVPLLQIPTAFSIPHADVHRLEQAGRDALRASPRFQQLKAALKARTATDTAPQHADGAPAAE